MNIATNRPIQDVVDRIERSLQARSHTVLLEPDMVEALDVIQHALTFTHHPRGLALWREALWERKFSDETRQALVSMFEYLTEATAHGDTAAISEICDCLHGFVEMAGGSVGPNHAAREVEADGDGSIVPGEPNA